MEGKGEQRLGGFSFFFVFNRKRKKQWKKYFVHFVGNFSRISKLFFFSFYNIKTKEILFYYIYIYIYLYIYKKQSPKLKNCHEQKVFIFRFYKLCENFSKIGPIIKKWGQGGPNLTFFNVYFHYLFI